MREEENFRMEPNGARLGRLSVGTPLNVISRNEGWAEVDVVGWIWERSLQMDDREGMDVVVFVDGGENLRAEPSGTILGRMDEGTLLEELDREPGWIQVRRRGWIWEASLQLAGEVEAPPLPAPTGGGAQSPEGPASTPPGGFAAAPRGAPILATPGGDTLALAVGGAELETLAREGSWVRVRVEGWTWMPLEPEPEEEGAEGEALTPDDLKADPDGTRGRAVAWRLQFISVEEAERVRTDFYEGEPFLLCRFGSTDGPFVYVAVPPERIGDVGGLVPLEFIQVTGRVRTGASALTGTPIVDLHALERVRNER